MPLTHVPMCSLPLADRMITSFAPFFLEVRPKDQSELQPFGLIMWLF